MLIENNAGYRTQVLNLEFKLREKSPLVILSLMLFITLNDILVISGSTYLSL
jgi:hypothetical protein